MSRAQAKPATKPVKADRQAIIDELGEVERQYRLWTPGTNPHAARLAELSAIIRGWYGAKAPADSFIEEGKRYRLEVKPCQFRRDVTPEAQEGAFEAIKSRGIDPFSVFRATQEAIQRLMGEAFLEGIAPKHRTGPRTFTLVAKAAPQLVPAKAKEKGRAA